MIAKTGIIVSTAVAGLVAVSPLAYAACNHDNHHSNHHDRGHHYVQADYHHNNHGRDGDRHSRDNSGDRSCSQRTAGVSTGSGRGGGLIDISNNTIQVPVQACNNNILSNLGLGILGSGRANSH